MFHVKTRGFFTFTHPLGWVGGFIEGCQLGAVIAMDANELLSVSPKLLAQAILHQRERLIEQIPDQLEASKSDLEKSEPLAKAARLEVDKINSKVSKLKGERDAAQGKAKLLFQKSSDLWDEISESGGIRNPNPQWAKDKLSQRLKSIEDKLQTSAGNHKTEEKYINEMKNLIREHEEWVESNAASQPQLIEMREARKEAKKLLEVAQKAHEAMIELVEENEEKHNQFMTWEKLRRSSISKKRKFNDVIKFSEKSIEFWTEKIENENFESLLKNSVNVKLGEPSSFALARAQKIAEESNQSGGEEE